MIGIGHGAALAVLAAAALSGCGDPGDTGETSGSGEIAETAETAGTVLFIHPESISIRGPVEMVEGPEGEPIPYLWSPGTVVVFRADRTMAGHEGRAGRAYRIVEGGDLEEIGRVDTDRTDDELASDFGVEPRPPAP